MNTSQQIANCTGALANEFNLADIPKIERILKSHFADEPERKPECKCKSIAAVLGDGCEACNPTEQPSKSLDDIVDKYAQLIGENYDFPNFKANADTIRQACIEYAAQLQLERDSLNRQVEELLQERNQLRVEIEKVKAERNKAAMVERRKYLPKLTKLRAQLEPPPCTH